MRSQSEPVNSKEAAMVQRPLGRTAKIVVFGLPQRSISHQWGYNFSRTYGNKVEVFELKRLQMGANDHT